MLNVENSLIFLWKQCTVCFDRLKHSAVDEKEQNAGQKKIDITLKKEYEMAMNV